MLRPGVVGLILLLGAPLSAQDQPGNRRLTVGPIVGALIPTGAQRDDFKSATSVGAQVTWSIGRQFRLVGTGAWTHGHHKFPAAGDRVGIWQYDAGVEFTPCGACTGNWELHPILGLGAGGRTNDYRAKGFESTTCLAGYGALGAEIQGPSLVVRAEGRDYLSCHESPLTGGGETRNDVRVTLMGGLRF